MFILSYYATDESDGVCTMLLVDLMMSNVESSNEQHKMADERFVCMSIPSLLCACLDVLTS